MALIDGWAFHLPMRHISLIALVEMIWFDWGLTIVIEEAPRVRAPLEECRWWFS